MSKRFSTFEESPQMTLGTFWWLWLWTNSPHTVSCNCYVPQHSTEDTPLKQLLLRRYNLSAAERADKLLSLPSLGDRSAADLMDSMLSLLSSNDGGFLFPHIFLCHLLPLVHATLANSPCLAAGYFWGLIEEADKVLLSSRPFSVQNVESHAMR